MTISGGIIQVTQQDAPMKIFILIIFRDNKCRLTNSKQQIDFFAQKNYPTKNSGMDIGMCLEKQLVAQKNFKINDNMLRKFLIFSTPDMYYKYQASHQVHIQISYNCNDKKLLPTNYHKKRFLYRRVKTLSKCIAIFTYIYFQQLHGYEYSNDNNTYKQVSDKKQHTILLCNQNLALSTTAKIPAALTKKFRIFTRSR
eukprot:TRINITY_DN2489_c0_g1_i4.p3 TRINITY_DN2489_c0_g1~~TRINITY_DN2489_c0_g1_i4.p3  ORF type:complete len:198 (+),score=-0.96 TRINITY_DN2489_c0_g1_i4:2896-3489(+)